jgi:hypothetical protein
LGGPVDVGRPGGGGNEFVAKYECLVCVCPAHHV